MSSNIDIDPDFGFESAELVRGGYVWVGVSAQAAGINNTSGGPFGATVGLKAWDPERYGSLHHPGDAYSYDIFTQAGMALRNPKGADPLRGLDVKQFIADGESQSAFRMVTYVNAIQPLAHVYDGFLIHSRSGGAAPLFNGPGGVAPSPAKIRSDLEFPVLQVQTETDIFELGRLGTVAEGLSAFPPASQPDTKRIRTWEVAGTAHADARYLFLLSVQGQQAFGPSFATYLPAVIKVADAGPENYVIDAAVYWLSKWAAGGPAPPTAPRFEIKDNAIARDANGNALGGVRTPQLDVPIATFNGEDAGLTGTTTPFSAAILASLYPTHKSYVDAFDEATDRAVMAGFILPADAILMKQDAASSNVGG